LPPEARSRSSRKEKTARSRRSRPSRRPTRFLAAVALALALGWWAGQAAAQDTAQEAEPVPLQLEIKVNRIPLNAIGAFALLPDGKIGSMRSELTEIGVALPDGPPEEIIPLDAIAGLSYVYDEDNQVIELEIADGRRLAKAIDAVPEKEDLQPVAATGMVVNYTAYGNASYKVSDSALGLNGGSINLDARAFSPYGTLRQTGIVGTTTFSDFTALRLDTSWSYADEKRALNYRLGDIVSGGLNWTRPVRLGGAQVRRNFDLRPDLITMPVPTVEGSAKVPSTLDVYIDGMKAYSGAVSEGPFRLDNVPVYTSEGTVRVVLTDSTGREVSSETDFITSPQLLKRGLSDFSAEVGALRHDFGVDSFGYDERLAALGSLRYGILDILTGEAHVEYGDGQLSGADSLISGGAGLLFNAGKFGLVNVAGAASTFGGDTGVFAHLGWEGHYGPVGLTATVSRTFGEFNDLAAISVLGKDGRPDPAVRQPRELEQIAVSYSMPKIKAGMGASLVHQVAGDGTRSLILSGSYSQTLFDDVTLYATAYADFGDDKNLGIFAGVSIPLGDDISATTSASATDKGIGGSADIAKAFGDEDIPYAWRVGHAEGDDRLTQANAAAKLGKATVQGMITQRDDSVRANMTVEGALALADGTVMAGRRIDDSFAIVNVGAANVPVEFENRAAGVTDGSGRLLLPQLNSYHKNRISIDVSDLPLTADVGETEITVVPREMAGVTVSFGVRAEQQAALVVLVDPSGRHIPESSEVYLEGAAEPFLVGYDGQVYLTGVKDRNAITVKTTDSECRANFDFKAEGDTQVAIGPLTCS
jgi:outer membrane usher protein